MRFIGNKKNLLDKIYFTLKQRNVIGNSFFDFFSGTTNVARFFKDKGYQVFSSDLLYLSYCLQYAYIKNNNNPKFDKLLPRVEIQPNYLIYSPLEIVLNYLNQIPMVKGFVYNNYSVGGTSNLKQPRMYLSDNNAQKVDAIRIQIELWRNSNLLTNEEYFILITCLIESVSLFTNVAGVYAAFQKKWDPRAIKSFILKPIKFVFNDKVNEVFNKNSMDLVPNINVDILYLDPPYNERQYAPNYHLLETIAKYDNPEIRGITGMRNYDNQKSSFCNKDTALKELNIIAKNANYRYLILSYNTEGIMLQTEIIKTMEQYGKVELVEFEYLRFKSNSTASGKTRKNIKEQLYIVNKG